MFDDTCFETPETPEQRAHRVELRRCQHEAGTFVEASGEAIAGCMMQQAVFTPILDLQPHDRALLRETWTQHRRLAAEDAREHEDWRSKRLALTAAQDTPDEATFAQRQAADRRFKYWMAFVALLMVAMLLISAHSLGLAGGMR